MTEKLFANTPSLHGWRENDGLSDPLSRTRCPVSGEPSPREELHSLANPRGRPTRSGFFRCGNGPCCKDSISVSEVRRDCAISHASFKLGLQYTALRTRSTRSPGRLTVSRTIRGCGGTVSFNLEDGIDLRRCSFLAELFGAC